MSNIFIVKGSREVLTNRNLDIVELSSSELELLKELTKEKKEWYEKWDDDRFFPRISSLKALLKKLESIK